MAKQLVTAEDVREVAAGGELIVGPAAIVTPWAREIAATRGVRIVLRADATATMRGPDDPASRTIAIGGDHGGYALKDRVGEHLTRLGLRVRDVGTHSSDAVDYPDIALAVAQLVQSGQARLGILVDAAGLGSAMAANKVAGVRAALCHDVASARNAREHNDANVLTLGARFVDEARMREVVEVFTSAHCSEARHLRRVALITAIERNQGQGGTR